MWQQIADVDWRLTKTFSREISDTITFLFFPLSNGNSHCHSGVSGTYRPLRVHVYSSGSYTPIPWNCSDELLISRLKVSTSCSHGRWGPRFCCTWCELIWCVPMRSIGVAYSRWSCDNFGRDGVTAAYIRACDDLLLAYICTVCHKQLCCMTWHSELDERHQLLVNVWLSVLRTSVALAGVLYFRQILDKSR